jgi:hypothetical protein
MELQGVYSMVSMTAPWCHGAVRRGLGHRFVVSETTARHRLHLSEIVGLRSCLSCSSLRVRVAACGSLSCSLWQPVSQPVASCLTACGSLSRSLWQSELRLPSCRSLSLMPSLTPACLCGISSCLSLAATPSRPPRQPAAAILGRDPILGRPAVGVMQQPMGRPAAATYGGRGGGAP